MLPLPSRASRERPIAPAARTVVTPAILVLAGALLSAGCDSDKTQVTLIQEAGVSSADFQSIADYLANPTVQEILESVPRYEGGAAPDVSGRYDAVGQVAGTTIPSVRPGDSFRTLFCVGGSIGGSVIVEILDPTVEDSGAASFIEGSGDHFTIFTAFRSVQPLDDGTHCEIHEVDVISGRRNPDGSLSELWIGQGVVGLIGDCGDLLAGDVQIGETSGFRIGDACGATSPGTVSGDEVELVIENQLINPILVFVDYPTVLGPQPFLVFGGEVSQPTGVTPGFSLSFESLQPASFDIVGTEVLLGEIVSGFFSVDGTPAGESVTYVVENQVGDEIYWAPLPVNQTGEAVYAVVNPGIDYGALPPPPDLSTGLGCLCPIDPSTDPYNIGYYSYSIPGFIAPEQTGARFFAISDDVELVSPFVGPFSLGEGDGIIVLRLELAAGL